MDGVDKISTQPLSHRPLELVAQGSNSLLTLVDASAPIHLFSFFFKT